MNPAGLGGAELDHSGGHEEPAHHKASFEMALQRQQGGAEGQQDDEHACAADQEFSSIVGQLGLRREAKPDCYGAGSTAGPMPPSQ